MTAWWLEWRYCEEWHSHGVIRCPVLWRCYYSTSWTSVLSFHKHDGWLHWFTANVGAAPMLQLICGWCRWMMVGWGVLWAAALLWLWAIRIVLSMISYVAICGGSTLEITFARKSQPTRDDAKIFFCSGITIVIADATTKPDCLSNASFFVVYE